MKSFLILVAVALMASVAVAGPLHEAVHAGNVEEVRRLIGQGIDLEARTPKGAATALHLAAYFDQPEIAEILVEAGAEVDALGGPQRTPLHVAAMAGSVAVATLLIDNGAVVNALDSEPTSPLGLAVAAGKPPTAKLLLERGADVNLELAGGTTALHGVTHSTVESARAELAELLVEHGADVNVATTKEGSTPLHSAALFGSTECAEVFIVNGADIEAEDSFGHRPLHNAAATGQASFVELLIDSGADVNARDKKGLTPLHWASAKGRLRGFLVDWGLLHSEMVSNKDYDKTIERLIGAGADLNAKNKKGRTPLAVAKKSKNQDVVDLLQQHGAQ
jgi:cytohesin